MTGKVKWFDSAKGFGFITGDDGADYFVHRTAFASSHDRRAQLFPGEAVSFDVVPGIKQQMQAGNVRKIASEA